MFVVKGVDGRGKDTEMAFFQGSLKFWYFHEIVSRRLCGCHSSSLTQPAGGIFVTAVLYCYITFETVDGLK
jgi:hypothetical protein